MPHVVIEQARDLRSVCVGLKPFAVREGDQIVKVVDVFLNQSERTALVECVVIEVGKPQSFFVQLARKEEQITVRLLPATDPEKTLAVKKLMGLIAKKVRDLLPGASFGQTNLHDFLGG